MKGKVLQQYYRFISKKSVGEIWAKTFFLLYSLFWEALTSSILLFGLVSDSIMTHEEGDHMSSIKNKNWFQKIRYVYSILKLWSTFRFWNQIHRIVEISYPLIDFRLQDFILFQNKYNNRYQLTKVKEFFEEIQTGIFQLHLMIIIFKL